MEPFEALYTFDHCFRFIINGSACTKYTNSDRFSDSCTKSYPSLPYLWELGLGDGGGRLWYLVEGGGEHWNLLEGEVCEELQYGSVLS